MTERQSKASKARWANVSPEERSKKMRKVVNARFKGMSQRKKNEIGRRLTAARLAKQAKNTT